MDQDVDEPAERPLAQATSLPAAPGVRRSITQNSVNTNRESTVSFNEAASSQIVQPMEPVLLNPFRQQSSIHANEPVTDILDEDEDESIPDLLQ